MSLQNKTFKNSHTTDNDIGLLKLVRLKYSTIDDVALDNHPDIMTIQYNHHTILFEGNFSFHKWSVA